MDGAATARAARTFRGLRVQMAGAVRLPAHGRRSLAVVIMSPARDRQRIGAAIGGKYMTIAVLEGRARDLFIRLSAAMIAVIGLLAFALTQVGGDGLRLLLATALAASVAAGGAALCMLVQQQRLGMDAALHPLAVARWASALLAAVIGPLLTALLVLGVVWAVAMAISPQASAGSLAGVGVAWLVLPMALLITGTAALRTVAVAAGCPLDVRDAIALVEGQEWSLVPVGLALALAVLLTLAGVVGVALGFAAAAAAILLGLSLLVPASIRLAVHGERLGLR